jgi:hypothetical protein
MRTVGISFEAIWRSERPKREAIFGLFVCEGVKKKGLWDVIERSAERIVERRIDAIAADGEASDQKRGEQVIAGYFPASVALAYAASASRTGRRT